MKITSIKPSQRVKGRWLVQLEDGNLLRVGEQEVVSFSLSVEKELSPEACQTLLASVHQSNLKEKALQWLTRKPMSRRELEGKLREWEATQEESDAICDRLEELGILQDARYAEQIVRHYTRKGYGTRKLQAELYRRGIPRELWEEALSQASQEEQNEAIDAFLQKKLKGANLDDPKVVKRVSDGLARRGYAWSEISQAMRRYGASWEE